MEFVTHVHTACHIYSTLFASFFRRSALTSIDELIFTHEISRQSERFLRDAHAQLGYELLAGGVGWEHHVIAARAARHQPAAGGEGV